MTKKPIQPCVPMGKMTGMRMSMRRLTVQYFPTEADTAKFDPIRHYFIDSSAATALLYFQEDDDFELESGGNEQENRIITRGLNPDPRNKRRRNHLFYCLEDLVLEKQHA